MTASVAPPEHFDVLVIGAGLSGIGAGAQLAAESPGTSFAILEGRGATGGTWDLFRYPGIRSDSDMFTLGYSFKPWEDPKAIADGPAILKYIRETAREHDLGSRIRLNHRIVAAEWSSADSRWTLEIERTDTGESLKMTCGFLYGCTGYFDYAQGYSPEFAGLERFRGEVVHPQHWPEDLDYSGKRVVIVGSGATAVTLVPAMAGDAEHVTMLQRSPSYVISLPAKDPFADLVRRLFPPRIAYPIARWKNVLLTQAFFALSRRRPEWVKRVIRSGVRRHLPPDYDVDVHFKPTYNPWDQRVCLVPDNDLFDAVGNGTATIVTDRIGEFTEGGLRLESGAELEADVIVTATGLNLQTFGGASLTVDGRAVDIAETVGYKGIMFSGIPNFAVAFGYTNASWTLKADLSSHYVCRLVNHMAERGYAKVVPNWPSATLPDEPFIDFSSGYVQRAIHLFPKQGPEPPWRLHQNYPRDVRLLKRAPIADEALEFSRAPAREAAEAVAA